LTSTGIGRGHIVLDVSGLRTRVTLCVRQDMHDSVAVLDAPGLDEKTKTASTARLRLCLLKLWSNFDRFGFELTAERSRQGLYIGDVEDASPAKAGGLQTGDRIIEVNRSLVSHLYGHWPQVVHLV